MMMSPNEKKNPVLQLPPTVDEAQNYYYYILLLQIDSEEKVIENRPVGAHW